MWSNMSPMNETTVTVTDSATSPARHAIGLERSMEFRFTDRRLLMRALCHRSYVAENPGLESNERLEFLGDAVLGLAVADELFRRWPDAPEGTLAKARAAVVNSEFLASVATDSRIGDHILLGKGEDATGGREKPSILADAIEAIIGAVYLDGGFGPACDYVLTIVGPRLEDAVTGDGSKDFKTRLQELAVRAGYASPVYVVESSGPDHSRRFSATVEIGGSASGMGNGRSKKQAEQSAARSAWEVLTEHDDDGAAPSRNISTSKPPEDGHAGTT